MKFCKTIFCCSLFFIVTTICAQDSTLSTASSYTLFPGDITISPGSSAHLAVQYVNKDGVISTVPAIGLQWTIDGKDVNNQNAAEGQLKISLQSGADYTAPATPPPHNPVSVTVTFADSNASGHSKAKLILLCHIHIIDQPNFFSINNNELFVMKEPLSDFQRKTFETAVNHNGQLALTISGSDTSLEKSMVINLVIAGNTVGSYPWQFSSSDYTTAQVGSPSKSFSYISRDCVPHGSGDCKQISLQGITTITSIDKASKQVRGIFYGAMHYNDTYTTVSGGFRVFLNQ